MIGFLRNAVPDLASPQLTAGCPVAVRLVSGDAVGPGTRSARPDAWHPDLVHHGLELCAVGPLACGDDDRQGAALAVGAQVDLRGEAAARAAECLTGGSSSTRRLDDQRCSLPWFSASCSPFWESTGGGGSRRAPAAC